MNSISKKRIMLLSSFLIIAAMITITSFIYSNKKSKAASARLDLNQKQLLLLNNYLYLENSADNISIKDRINSLKTDGKIDKSKLNITASGIRPSNMVKALEDLEKDKLLMSLVPVYTLETEIRAVCFVPKENVNKVNAEAVLVFLGTKPIENAWLDCLAGSYNSDTPLQLEAAAFHKKISEKYTVTNVTGHSKGGNLSQYITVTNGDKIRKCVSFDGQGFSDLFIDKYKDLIAKNSSKILTIASFKEPVHMLLTNISGETINIKTDDEVDPLSSHVSSYLYDENFFDENGNYKEETYTEASKFAVNVGKLAQFLVTKLDDSQLQSISEGAAPSLTYVVTLLQEAMENEDDKIIKALYEEIKERFEENKHSRNEEIIPNN